MQHFGPQFIIIAHPLIDFLIININHNLNKLKNANIFEKGS